MLRLLAELKLRRLRSAPMRSSAGSTGGCQYYLPSWLLLLPGAVGVVGMVGVRVRARFRLCLHNAGLDQLQSALVARPDDGR